MKSDPWNIHAIQSYLIHFVFSPILQWDDFRSHEIILVLVQYHGWMGSWLSMDGCCKCYPWMDLAGVVEFWKQRLRPRLSLHLLLLPRRPSAARQRCLDGLNALLNKPTSISYRTYSILDRIPDPILYLLRYHFRRTTCIQLRAFRLAWTYNFMRPWRDAFCNSCCIVCLLACLSVCLLVC